MTPFAQDAFARPTLYKLEENVDLTLTSANGIKQGQFVKRVTDGTNLVLRPALLNTDGPDVRGVSEFTFPEVDDPAGTEVPKRTFSPASVLTSGIFMMRGKSGQTFTPGLPVVIDEGNGDGQTVRLQGGDGFGNVVAEVAQMDSIAAGTTFGVVGDGTSFNVPVVIAPPGLGRNNGTFLTII